MPAPTDLRIAYGTNAASVIDLSLRPVGLSPAEQADVGTDRRLHDLEPVSGQDLIAQAVWLRLALPQGELAHLGHPDFGSRLYRLIGRRLTRATLALAEAYVREALRREPLVAQIAGLRISGDPRSNRLLIALQVHPAAAGTAEPAVLDLALRLSLDPGDAP